MTGLICCTLECNLACTYCYEGNGLKKEMPSIASVNKQFADAMEEMILFIDELYEYNDGLLTEIIWHGGEPLLINIDLLEKIMKDQRIKKHKIKWAIQTNGTLLNEKVCKVFKEYKVSVGISIDGLKAHHDKFRVMKNGRGTYDLILSNIEKARKMGITCGALVTITDNNVMDLSDIYHSFAEKGLNFSFNALFPTAKNAEEASLDVKDYSKAICNLFDLWVDDVRNNIKISPFEQIIEGLLKPWRGIPACHWAKNCSNSFVAIDHTGSLYPCEHWVGSREYCFGNIREGLRNALKNNTYFAKRTDYLKDNECMACSIFPLCYGGCPWNGMILTGNHMKKDSSICEGRKEIITHIYQRMQQNLKDSPFGSLSFEEYINEKMAAFNTIEEG